MKKNILLTSFLIITLFCISCEEGDWKEPSISKVPIYLLSEMEGETPFEIEVYRQQNLMIENSSSKLPKLTSFVTREYSDTSNETDYSVGFITDVQTTTIEEEIISETIKKEYVTVTDVIKVYTIIGDVVTGEGSLEIESTSQKTYTTREYVLQENGEWVMTENDPVVGDQETLLIESNATVMQEERYL
ncbi:hypothetical protein [Labilibacter marinus]|uniref:hypothetical protein n=1 Tax=Labilibacter marinus TaxID=1477105 RepID=UPI00095012C0|nr:hypothetical protein [Labilibacter marinus]